MTNKCTGENWKICNEGRGVVCGPERDNPTPTGWHRSDFTVNFKLGEDRPENATSDPNEWQPLYDAATVAALVEEVDRLRGDDMAAYNRGIDDSKWLVEQFHAKFAAAEARATAAEQLLAEAREALVWFFDATDAELTRLAKKKARDLRDRLGDAGEPVQKSNNGERHGNQR